MALTTVNGHTLPENCDEDRTRGSAEFGAIIKTLTTLAGKISSAGAMTPASVASTGAISGTTGNFSGGFGVNGVGVQALVNTNLSSVITAVNKLNAQNNTVGFTK